jgi:hypothetical protein
MQYVKKENARNKMKLKKIISENMYLGELPSSKLPKMKWNPLTDKNPVNEEYIESMNLPVMDKHLDGIKELWLDWKNGPMTEKSDIKPAQKELMSFIASWMKKNIK